MADSELDKAQEIVGAWAGAPRDLLATVLVAPFIYAIHAAAISDQDKSKRVRDAIKGAIDWADVIKRTCKETPPQ